MDEIPSSFFNKKNSYSQKDQQHSKDCSYIEIGDNRNGIIN